MPPSSNRRDRRGRPHWWPEDADWPPPHEAMRGQRRRFLIFIAIALVALFALVFLAGIAASSAFHGGQKSGDRDWNGPPVFGFVFLVVAILLIVRFLRRTAAPIGDVMDMAERVAGGDYAARVQPRGPREMRRLAGSFNEMVARLESNDEQRRRLLADVTHELRTPLSVIRGNVEGMLDGVYPRDDDHLAPIVDETKLMARLLDDLHTLATAEAGALQLHKEAIDPAELIADIVAAWTPRANERGVEIVQSVSPMPEIELDPVRLRQVLENVLANAVRYTPSGGSIRIDAEIRDNELVCSIADTGPGVPADALPHLFDRFTKSADSGGSGLGLAIARRLVEAHGGTITARNASPHGMIVRFAIPV